MNTYCQSVCSDPKYLLALRMEGPGFDRNSTVEYGGRVYTHDDVAQMFHESYSRHRGEFVPPMGARQRIQRKNERRFRAAVRDDVYSSFHISWMTIVMAGIMFALAGPLGLVIAVVTCLFEYYFSKDLDGDQALMAAVGA